MKFVKTSTSYRIDISRDELLAILVAESDNFNQQPIEPTLDQRLDALDGVQNVEYNGHFGPSIFFTVLAENDHRATQASVLSIIREFITEAREFNEKAKLASK